MSAEQLPGSIADLYVVPAAAAALLPLATASEPSEQRERAARALRLLDPAEALPIEPDVIGCPACGRDACDGRCPPPDELSGGLTGRVFAPVPLRDFYASTSDVLVWLWVGLLPLGALVLLAAFQKSGKTTFVYRLLAALLQGQPFLGRETKAVPVLLWAIEEAPRDVKRRLLRFNVPADAPLYVQTRPVPTNPAEWAELVTFVRDHGIKLIVIDTLARCWPVWGVESENDNAAVAAALAPLLDLCHQDSITAVLLHHTGKLAEASHGREVRGAGAILALADQALLLDRYKAGDPCDRIIRTLGRYEESPAQVIVRYDVESGDYTLLEGEQEDPAAHGATRLFPQVLTYLRRRKATGASLRDVRANVTGARATTKDRAVELLVEQAKAVLRDGRYYHADYDPEATR